MQEGLARQPGEQEVEHHRLCSRQQVDCRLRIRRPDRGQAAGLQLGLEQVGEPGVVLDDEDVSRLRFLSHNRDCEREDRALAQTLRADADLAAVALDDVLADRKSQAGSPDRAAVSRIHSEELRKELREGLRRNAEAVILDRDFDHALDDTRADDDRPAKGRILARVRKHVDDHAEKDRTPAPISSFARRGAGLCSARACDSTSSGSSRWLSVRSSASTNRALCSPKITVCEVMSTWVSEPSFSTCRHGPVRSRAGMGIAWSSRNFGTSCGRWISQMVMVVNSPRLYPHPSQPLSFTS